MTDRTGKELSIGDRVFYQHGGPHDAMFDAVVVKVNAKTVTIRPEKWQIMRASADKLVKLPQVTR